MVLLLFLSPQGFAQSFPKSAVQPPVFGCPEKLRLGQDVEEAKRDAERANPFTGKPAAIWKKADIALEGYKAYEFELFGMKYTVAYKTKGSEFGQIAMISVSVDKPIILEGLMDRSPISIYRDLKKQYEQDFGKNGKQKQFDEGFWTTCLGEKTYTQMAPSMENGKVVILDKQELSMACILKRGTKELISTVNLSWKERSNSASIMLYVNPN